MVATGFEYKEEQDVNKSQETPRLDVSEIVFSDTFGEVWAPTTTAGCDDANEEEDLISPVFRFPHVSAGLPHNSVLQKSVVSGES